MLKRIVILSVGLCSLFMVSCGKRAHLSSPTDGQVFQLAQSNGQYIPQQLIIQLDDPNAYDRVQISIVGQERLPQGMLQNCAGGGNQAMYCTVVYPTSGAGIQQGSQYAILVKATDGDYVDTRIVYFQIGTPFQQQQIPPRP